MSSELFKGAFNIVCQVREEPGGCLSSGILGKFYNVKAFLNNQRILGGNLKKLISSLSHRKKDFKKYTLSLQQLILKDRQLQRTLTRTSVIPQFLHGTSKFSSKSNQTSAS